MSESHALSAFLVWPAAALVVAAALAVCPLAMAAGPPETPGAPRQLPAGGDVPDPGVPADLASARAAAITDLRYEATFRLPGERSRPVEGRVVVRFARRGSADDLVLDFEGPADGVRAVTSLGEPVSVRVARGHIVVPAAALADGDNVVAVDFVASDAALNRADDYLYTLFVPARAHLAFPCFDQPGLKARFSLTLEVPESWQALANGPQVERVTSSGRATVRFGETKPLPTYLFAFAAGRFSVDEAVRDGRTFRMFHRETDAARLARNREAIFDLHASALAWLERYTAIPYPWSKFDFFLAPAFQFSGMEHAGAIYYNASSLLLEESATKNQQLGRASLIAHETAHMWFGDLVTMRWFDDVWMKEVFANFMAAKIVNPSFPEIDHDLRFLFAHYPGAYDVDRTGGTHPIRQPLDNLNDAGTLYGAIIYQKAPVVMRQLERQVGEEVLRDGLRAYLKRYAFGNASWPDLIALLDERTDGDLAAWSRAWVEEAGRPTIRTELALDADGRIAELALVQEDPLGRGLVWPQELQVVVGHETGARAFAVQLSAGRAVVAGARGLTPRFVLPNGGGLGYGLFLLDDRSRAWLTTRLSELPDALTRGSALTTLWDQMLEGLVPPATLADLALEVLPGEGDELNVQRLLGDLGAVYWRFLPEEARLARTTGVEAVLRQGLERAPTSSLKGAWFRALRGLARSPETVAWLERVWRQSERVEGLVLSEPDFTALAQALAVRAVEGWRGILDEQEARIENPDRRERFAFVRPALDADGAVRDRFFASLADPANRRREPWVLDGLSFLHHPLRAASAEKYVEPSLDLLEEIQRTGDIFFPNNWTNATLGGHGSERVAQAVRAFLEARPGYPPRLRRIVLQAADDLFRASRIVR